MDCDDDFFLDDDFIQSCQLLVHPSANYPEDPIEDYLLLAPHKASRRPLVAEKALEEDDQYFAEIRSRVLPPERREMLLCRYAAKNPGVVPVTAVLFCLQEDYDEDVLSRVLTENRHYFASVGIRNCYGQTTFMVIVKRRLGAKVLRTALQIRDEVKIIDYQDPKGSTAAHYCARTNGVQYITVLIENGADLTIKDFRSKTPGELAWSRGFTEMFQKLPESKDAHFQDDTPKVVLGDLPLIYNPADQDGSTGSSTQGILEYLRKELPALLRIQPSFVVVPDEFPMECPQEEEGLRNGWEDEKKVFTAMRDALELMRKDNQDLLIACFHSLRNGCQLEGMRWESDVDLAILCLDTSTGAHCGIFVEVMSPQKKRDIIRISTHDGPNANVVRNLTPGTRPLETETTGLHARKQLLTDLQTLKESLGVDVSWMKGCLALPNYPANNIAGDQSHALEEEIRERFDDLSQDSRFEKLKPKVLTRTKLGPGSTWALKEWLKEQLQVPCRADVANLQKNIEQFLRMVAWGLMHCMGVTMNAPAEWMEKGREYEATILENRKLEKFVQKVSLLTADQKKVLESDVKSFKPALILGGTGTGKTFIGMHKLIKLKTSGLINAEHIGVLVTASSNAGLNAITKLQLNGIDHIEHVPIANSLDAIEETLQGLKKKKADYVIFDQLEDFQGFFKSSLFSNMMDCHDFKLLWLMSNPFDVDDPDERRAIFNYAQVAGNVSHCMMLDQRIRNTKDISIALERIESSHPSMVALTPEPVGKLAGIPALLAQFYEDCVDLSAKLGILVQSLYLLMVEPYSNRAEDILLIPWDEDGFDNLEDGLVKLELALISQFAKTMKGKMPSMAPIVIQAPLINLKQQLEIDERELEEARRFLQFLPENSWDSEEIRALTAKVMQLDIDTMKGDPDVSNNVALQACAGLARRWIALTKLSSFSDISEDNLKQLQEATKSADKLRKFILGNCFLSMMNWKAIRGYEAKVVVIVDKLSIDDEYVSYKMDLRLMHRLLSRAKFMSLLVARQSQEWHVNKALGKVERLDGGQPYSSN